MACPNHPTVSEGLLPCSRCGFLYCRDCIIELAGKIVCARCKGERLLDVKSGVSGALDLASIWRRWGAAILDTILLWIPTYGISKALQVAFFGSAPPEPSLRFYGVFFVIGIVSAIPFLIYEGFLLARNGQTLGKKALSIRVVNADGSPLQQRGAWFRAIARFVLNNWLSVIDLLPALFTPEKTTLHDMAAKTRVVNVRQ